MLLKQNSRLLKVIMFINSPTMYLPRLFPLFVMNARVGTNMTDYVNVSFYPPKP